MSLKTVFSDSCFLEEMKIYAATASSSPDTKREYNKIAGIKMNDGNDRVLGNQQQLKFLVKMAGRNNLQLKLMPPGMSKSKQNQSKFIKKRKEISWTCEWILESCAASVLSHRHFESALLGEICPLGLKTIEYHIYIKNILHRVFVGCTSTY